MQETDPTEKDQVPIEQALSKLSAGYGAISPKQKPEHFPQVRETVEKEIAEDVVSEV